MDNTERSFDDYQKDVFVELKQYANFNIPDKETQQYMELQEVHG